MIQPTYYTRDIDGNYHEADPQPVLPEPNGPLMMQCSKCFGAGYLPTGTCHHCGGAGIYPEEPARGVTPSHDQPKGGE